MAGSFASKFFINLIMVLEPGPVFAIPTPFNDKDEVDYPALEDLLKMHWEKV